METIAIVGGGIGGTLLALELSEKYPEATIIVFEKNDDILQGTSGKHPGRMGFGFHYEDEATAELLMRSTIKWVRKFRQEQECSNLVIDEHISRG